MRKMPPIKKLIFVALGLLFSLNVARATHLRAGEITATRIDCSLEFRICIKAYVNTNTQETDVKFGGGVLSFGDGNAHRPPIQNSVPVPGADFVGVVEYCFNYTYQALGSYKISYYELNRNAGIENMTESINVIFYIESLIEIDPFKGCNSTPLLLVPPIDKACTGSRWQHNPGAFDPDGDSLSFKIIAPQTVSNTDLFVVDTVPGHQYPNAQGFYDDYENAQQNGPGRPIFNIDAVTGTITWDAPGREGEYNIAFIIFEWRKINNVYQKIGYIIRDMQIVVEDCPNKPPVVTGPAEICVVAGEPVMAVFEGTDPENNAVQMEMFGEIFSLDVSKATYSPINTNGTPVTQTTTPVPATLTLNWETKCVHIKQQPYLVVVKITDLPNRQSAFTTFRIRVVGPPPEWNSVTIGANRSAQLNWKPYDCATKADSMQIWRRIDSIAYTPQCESPGMPPGLGYEKIKTVRIGQTTYTDTNDNKGLPPGATVCYRLVATYPAPLGNLQGRTESLVSDQACLGPILVDAPIMTNVTVDTTNRTKGRITVRWTTPFDLNPAVNPPPYQYDVWRSTGFSDDINKVQVANRQTDTTFVDRNLNTLDNVFNYRVVAYDANNTLIDTSAIASSVRVQAKSLPEKIELIWTAEVPWSLQSPLGPYHYIYRGSENQTEGQFVLIDSIPSTQSILMYTDDGTFNGQLLQPNQFYCYRIETQGGYGFDDPSKFQEPFTNFSQIVCAQPSDETPPCQPTLALDILSCDEFYQLYGCTYNDYSNVLRWAPPEDDTCRDDISHYRIYYSPEANADTTTYQLLVDLADRPLDYEYIDRNLPSYARCYRLKAVDRSGNESKFSDEVCNDNCPTYNLPNVFTPGNNDDCNDLFSAYSDRNIINGIFQCGGSTASNEQLANIRALCPRFVLSVDIVIADRWGKQVYEFSSGGENSIFIDWDGRDNKGRALNSGIYFYSAKVRFDALKPADREKVIKGWVQLVRPNE